MNLRFASLMLMAAIAVTGRAAAEDEPVPVVDVPPPPPIDVDAEAAGEEEGLEPEVTIIQRRDATHEEYRINGRLYMVKVTPKVGPPYYYIDRDGDGLMETRMNDRAVEIKVPQWVIFSW